MMPVTLAFLLYTLVLSLYDLQTRQVPNWSTLPLLAAGFLAHFPGTFPVWIASVFVFLAWYFGQMGAGDAKLWMALFWATPPDQSANIPIILFGSLLGTALIQLLFRKLAGRPQSGQRSPAAARWWIAGADPQPPFDPIWQAIKDWDPEISLTQRLTQMDWEVSWMLSKSTWWLWIVPIPTPKRACARASTFLLRG